MTSDQLRELSRFPAFPDTARTLMRVAGDEAAAKLISYWPGQEPELPTRRSIESGRSRQVFGRLVDLIGEEASWKIIDAMGGGDLQIPNCKLVIRQRTQEVIRRRYDEMTTSGGMSHRDAVFNLGIDFNTAARSVERILKQFGTGVDVDLPRAKKQKAVGKTSAKAKFEEQQGSLF